MSTPHLPWLSRLPDGTVKQCSPTTGTQVWTVPGRGKRPLGPGTEGVTPLTDGEHGAPGQHCAFCSGRYLETTPEKARLVRDPSHPTGWATLSGLTAEQLEDTTAEFRLIPNLFEILALDYWRLGHGHIPDEGALARMGTYLGTPAGRAHVDALLRVRATVAGAAYDPLADPTALFASAHDVVVARRHYVDGARLDSEGAGSGDLTVAEHREFIAFTVAGIRGLFAGNAAIVNVAAFQNWRRPAGASFDHLHKQLVGVDTIGRIRELELGRLHLMPDLFTELVPAFVREQDLLIAENEQAFAFAGVGHRYPSIEVWSRHVAASPWELSRAELDGWSDLVHLAHRATGSEVPTNEEWHYRPPGLAAPMPLRAVLKWRVNTPAGFEGGTGIHINTIDPWAVRDRCRERLGALGG